MSLATFQTKPRCTQKSKSKYDFLSEFVNCRHCFTSSYNRIMPGSHTSSVLNLFAKDCLLTGQKQACSKITRWFDCFGVTMPKMAQHTGKWLLKAPCQPVLIKISISCFTIVWVKIPRRWKKAKMWRFLVFSTEPLTS